MSMLSACVSCPRAHATFSSPCPVHLGRQLTAELPLGQGSLADNQVAYMPISPAAAAHAALSSSPSVHVSRQLTAELLLRLWRLCR